MSEYPSPELLIQLLRQSGHRVVKSLGQHFMTDPGVLAAVVGALKLDATTLAVEIGPGPCTLTTGLAEHAGGVVSIEKDARLEAFHARLFSGTPRVRILYQDALRVDLREVVREHCEAWGLSSAVLTGNLPYQITSPLLFGQIGPDQPWRRMAVMIQKEVADRILAGPHSREYGILSVKLAYWWRAERVLDVPARMFTPPPKVDGTVLVFEPLREAVAVTEEEWTELSRFIDLAFNQRRKKLYNSPAATRFGKSGSELMRQTLESMDVNPNIRAEDLSPAEFLDLFRRMRA